MIPTFFNSFKCWETVGCAKGNSFTISPQMHESTFNRYSIIATLAGCEIALNKEASSFCCSEKNSDLDAPILFIYILQYYDKQIKQKRNSVKNQISNKFITFEILKKSNKMAQIKLKGNPVNTTGTLPLVGSKASDFTLVKNDLSTVSLTDFKGSKLVLNIFPSIDTSTCATSVRKFNETASNLENTKVLCISRDLPFAQTRFCGAEGLENVVNLSDFKDASFGNTYGLTITDGPLAGLHSRAVIVLDENGVVKYTEQVADIVDEPNYENALAAL